MLSSNLVTTDSWVSQTIPISWDGRIRDFCRVASRWPQCGRKGGRREERVSRAGGVPGLVFAFARREGRQGKNGEMANPKEARKKEEKGLRTSLR